MPDIPHDTVQPNTRNLAEERMPFYKRTAVIVALIGALAALTGTIIKVVLPKISNTTPKGSAVRGRVADTQMHPLSRAKVSLEGNGLPPVIYTDSEGIFTFNLPEDINEIKIRVEAAGYEIYDRRIDVSAKSELEDIRLTPQTKGETTSELSGTVVDSNGKPLQGARVTIDDVPGMTPVETSTDGVFNLRDVPKKYSEGVRVRVIMEGYQPNPYTEDVVLGKAPPIIKLTRKR